ncbi:MAG: caspase family protein [Methanosarcinaceae archaeon]|nr:caspase family protein [Methanosarcinaceae archaeon]
MRYKVYWCVFTLMLLIIALPFNALSKESRVALVIGNGAYKNSPLKNPVNDANDMATVLTDLGFKVIRKTNASRRDMVLAVNDFGRELRKTDVGLFYYAGHGMQIEGRNYLIPIGANVADEHDVEFEGVDAGRILGKMEAAGNTVNIVFLDACRDNPFTRSFRTSSRGLVRMDAPKGSFIAYATEPGNTSADGEGRNSPFTKHLLKYIKKPGLKIEDVVKRVRAEVTSETGDKQLPWQSSSLVGDFYFVIEGKVTVTQAPPTKVSEELEKERARLEKERKELERMKLEVERQKLEAERKRLEAEKKKLETTKLQPESKPKPKVREEEKKDVIETDERFIAYANGIVHDTKTGLEWVAGPDRDITWNEAKSWVESLKIDGSGWRMPSVEELVGLYKEGVGTRNMTSLLKTTGWWVYTGKYFASTKLILIFDFGDGHWSTRFSNYDDDGRAFAVRSRKQESKLDEQKENVASISQ